MVEQEAFFATAAGHWWNRSEEYQCGARTRRLESEFEIRIYRLGTTDLERLPEHAIDALRSPVSEFVQSELDMLPPQGGL